MFLKTITALVFILNFISSISLIFLNKFLFKNYNFSKPILISFHFLCTSIALTICCVFKMIRFKKLPVLKVFPLALSFTMSVLLANMSLDYNTMGTAQVLKCLADPLFVIVQAAFYDIHQPRSIKLSLIPMVVGILINSLYDLQFTHKGAIVGVAGAFVTAFYTIQVSVQQKQLNVTAGQLLAYQAPMSCVLLLVYTLVFSYNDFSQVNFSNSDGIFTAFLTGIAAFATNLSTYWILGNSGVITFAVLGKTKLCFTMVGAFLIFRDPFHWNQILGISITLIGVFLFTECLFYELV